MDASKTESLTSGTIAGAGSFRCQRCGFVLNLAASDSLTDCPSCGSSRFARASLFAVGRRLEDPDLYKPESGIEREALLSRARTQLENDGESGEHLVYEQDGELTVVPLTREWTRIGRSLTADVRFDDPTVSRRHALVVRHADGVRVLDDRSLNGVFVNGDRIEWRVLRDGDEIVVGRYRLHFLESPEARYGEPTSGAGALQA